MVRISRAEELAEGLSEQWRGAFIRFVETGEADKPFLAFIETDDAAQAAVEVMYTEIAAAFERLGALLHSGKTGSPLVGDRIKDGTLYAGSLAGRDIYTTQEDAPHTYTFNQAARYAKKLNRERYLGHVDWRVPSKDELNLLFNNRATIGGFDESGSLPAGWYVSSSQSSNDLAWAQRFNDGCQSNTYGKFFGYDASSLRCVRG